MVKQYVEEGARSLAARKVGKRIGGTLYIHRSAIANNKLVDEAIQRIPTTFDFAIVKINEKKREVSFIASHDWDSAHEPIVGDSYKVDMNTGKVTFRKRRKTSPQIYHHKWMFVDDSYDGFNVEESKQRSRLWQNSNIDYDSKKIGNLDYWNEVVVSKLKQER